ncbi:hypothetical protein BdWA1_001663 [Babesia duncani]|uniref:Uncharacterized protein n=1 Tax=Babesia duncani TaxID=323732 RepID=A0AAD9PKA5_9APIC|nr:hypothetical protein BdWA1_001663 [Babesia duncani]
MKPHWELLGGNNCRYLHSSLLLLLVLSVCFHLDFGIAIFARRCNTNISRKYSFLHGGNKYYNSSNCYRNGICPFSLNAVTSPIDSVVDKSENVNLSNLRPGKIVLGYLKKRNEDGSLDVDIGAPEPLNVSKKSLFFLNQEELKQIDVILKGEVSQERKDRTFEEIKSDTIECASKLPDRKRQMYFSPRYLFPFSYQQKQDEIKETRIAHAMNINEEFFNPNAASYNPLANSIDKPEKGTPVEILITNIDPLDNKYYGEFFSLDAVRNKCISYNNILMESVNPMKNIFPLNAVITERMDGLLKVDIISDKYPFMAALNTFTFANTKDKVGDQIKVYLGSADAALEHVYLFRKHIFNPSLRKEEIHRLQRLLYGYYVQSGTWFKCSKVSIDQEYVGVRIIGTNEMNIKGSILKSQLPIAYPDTLLDDAFIHLKDPSGYFIEKNVEERFGKLDYNYHYDNCFYARIDEFVYSNKADNLNNVDTETIIELRLSTVPIYNTDNNLETLFKKMKSVKFDVINKLNQEASYPCMLVAEGNGYVYFAINHKRRENFTLDDDFLVGILNVQNHARNIPIGGMINVSLQCINNCVQARVERIEAVYVDRNYLSLHSPFGGRVFKYNSFASWYNKNYGITSPENEPFYILWMDYHLKPSVDSPQFNELLAAQPIIGQSDTAGACADAITLKNAGTGLVPADVAKAYADSVYQQEETEHLPKDPLCRTYNEQKNRNTMIAPPAFYLHNDELRDAYYKGCLNLNGIRMYKHIYSRAEMGAKTMVAEYLVDIKGREISWLFESLKDPIKRRDITVKEAHYFNTKLKYLFAIYKDLYIDEYYDTCDKVQLAFATIIPKSLVDQRTFYQLDEIKQLKQYVRLDYAIPTKVRKSILEILHVLTQPQNLFLSQLRQRHREIPDDVYLYSKKAINFLTYKHLYFPTKKYIEKCFSKQRKTYQDTPIPKGQLYEYLMSVPENLTSYLYKSDHTRVARLYRQLLTRAHNSLQKRFHTIGWNNDSVRAEDLMTEEDLASFDAIHPWDIRREELEKQKEPKSEPTGLQAELQMTSRDWRKFNSFVQEAPMEDLKQYVRDLQQYRPIHAIKLPIST